MVAVPAAAADLVAVVGADHDLEGALLAAALPAAAVASCDGCEQQLLVRRANQCASTQWQQRCRPFWSLGWIPLA